ncbi:MAG: hypothetical protein RBU37_18085 [Myxococcota bacterium]|nr:hypothetical protein [Myxococcota bacterium]
MRRATFKDLMSNAFETHRRARILTAFPALLHSLAWLVCLFFLLPSSALAQWDPTRISQSKDAAQAAYEAGDYPEAARAYIELRNLLKTSLENGEVPEAYVVSVEQALLAISYQLGRSNQLSGNCSGAITVFSDIIVEPAADAVLRAKTHLRWAESELCVAGQLEAEGRYKELSEHLGQFRAQVEALQSMAQGEPSDEIVESLEQLDELEVRREELNTRAVSALLLRAERLLEAQQCENAAQTMQSAGELFELGGANLGLWMDTQQQWNQRCAEPAVVDEPAPVVDNDKGVDWLPWTLFGVGTATLVAAVVSDIVVSSQINDYESLLRGCKQGLADRCDDASREYDALSGRPTLVAALYISGGALTTGVLAYWLIDWLLAEEDSVASPAVSWTGNGVQASISITF